MKEIIIILINLIHYHIKHGIKRDFKMNVFLKRVYTKTLHLCELSEHLDIDVG